MNDLWWGWQWLTFFILAPLALAIGVGFLHVIGEAVGAWADRIESWAKRKERELNNQAYAKRKQEELDERRAAVREELAKQREKVH